MKVLVVGATGAIGRPLISALVSADHDVVGIAGSEQALETIEKNGAEGVVANALDSQAVEAALKKVRPEAVIDELTSLPKHYTAEEMRAAADRDRRVRLEGGRNVLNAARAVDVRRYIVQSTGFFYAPGLGLAGETEPLALHASPAIAASVQTYLQLEERALGAQDLEATVLRYGFFYGPGTWYSPDGDVARQVRKQNYPIAGSGSGVWSWVHIEDAAAATVAALGCAPGIYNIVDNDPSAVSVWLPAFAATVGAPEPPHLSEREALEQVGPDSIYYATRLRGASNAKAKRELAFSPRRLEWLAATKAPGRLTQSA